jgi:hypothetical protein
MKHILNNLSEQEKNSIREQHTGGIKVMTESFSKLLNSKLGDSKPLVSEQLSPKEELELDVRGIALQLVGKTIRFGKIEGTDNTYIKIVRIKDDKEGGMLPRNRSEIGGMGLDDFTVYFDVVTAKSNGGTWQGILEVNTGFDRDGSIAYKNPQVTLYPKNTKGGIDFGSASAMQPSPPWTWDTVGGQMARLYWNKVGHNLKGMKNKK